MGAIEHENDDRHPVEVLADEFARRIRRGERPTVEEFASAHPDLADEIRAILPTVEQLETAKLQAESSSNRPTSSRPKIERLGDLRIIREIGRGGMGIVYEAEQESLKRRVAVKVISKGSLLSDGQLQRFEREAQAAAHLHHTNIVPVFGVGESDGLHYYVMQVIDGRALNKVLRAIEDRRRNDENGAAFTDRETKIVRRPVPNATADDSESSVGDKTRTARSNGGLRLDLDPAIVFPGGRSIDEVFEDETGLYWRVVATIGIQVAEALHHAHSHGILHRDIKPSNLLVDEHGIVWVTDFGLAKLEEPDGLTKTGDVVGTLQYIAPETLHGKADARSDIYGLGLTLYELLTLRPAFDEETPAKLISEILNNRPMAPRKIDGDVPRDLETIVLKAISRDPERRYETARTLAEDLEAFVDNRPIRARRVSPAERAWRWCHRNPAVASLSGVAVVLLALVAVVATIGYIRTDDALQAVSEQSRKAKANLSLALEAFEEIFSQVHPAGLTLTIEDDDWPDEDANNVEESTAAQFPPAVSNEYVVILGKLLGFYEQFATENTDDPELQLDMARAHHRMGDIHQRFGRYDSAETAYRRSLEVYESLARADTQPGASGHWLERAQILNNLGLTQRTTDRFEDAGATHQKVLALLQGLPDSERASNTCKLELVRTYRHLVRLVVRGPRHGPRNGARGKSEGPPDGGPPPLVASFTIVEDLIAEEPSNPDYRLALALLYRDLNRFTRGRTRGRNQSSDTRDAKERSIEILKGLVDEFPANPDYAYELSMTYAGPRRRPRHRGESRRPHETRLREELMAAIGIDQELVRHYPGVPRYKVLLAQHQLRLADLLADEEDKSGAAAGYAEAVAALESLARASSLPSYGFFLAEAKYALGSLKLRNEAYEEARTIIGEAVESLERSAKRAPDNPRVIRLAVEQYEDLARVLRHLGDDAAADEADAKADRWREKRLSYRDRHGFRGRDGRRRPRGGERRGPRAP